MVIWYILSRIGTYVEFLQKWDHNIGFKEKRQFFCRKVAKIAENCDHNIDPWSQSYDRELHTTPML
jgi:hypothetical protein